MNLQEQINRIQKVMGVNEGIKEISFQKMIDNITDELNRICDNMSGEDEEIVSFSACDLLSSDCKINVTHVNKDGNRYQIFIDITYKNYYTLSEDELLLEISSRLKKLIGRHSFYAEMYNTFPPKDRQI